MGRVNLYGLKIAIEQPRNTYRTGVDPKTKKRWTSRVAAHYGYISATKGADGDGVDCFVGFYPQSEYVYVVNQNVGGRFDEHKCMLAFFDEDTATRAYMNSYERGWKGLGSIVQLSINQFKWWLKNGDMSRPIRKENLPNEGLEAMTKRVYWNNDAMPIGGITLDRVIYEIRKSDSGENLIMDAVTVQEIIDDSDGVLTLDALVSPFSKLERKMGLMRGVMERAGGAVKPVSMQVSDPFKQNGVANVAVVFELSDGQTISIYFHNPDVTPKKMAPTDEVISWKWMLNKKDITIVVAPERGKDLSVREVARRIMKLAEKNSAGFARANAKKAERMKNIKSLEDEIVELEKELADAQSELEVVKRESENKKAVTESMHIAVRKALSEMGWSGFDEGDAMSINDYRVSGNGFDSFKVERLDKESGSWEDVGHVSNDVSKTAQQIADEIVLKTSSGAPSVSDSQDLDPTSPEGYAKIMADESLQVNYQDVLDSFFQERIVAVRNALRELGWDGEKFKDLSKDGLISTFKFKYANESTRNVIGYYVAVLDGADFHAEFGDNLTKTPSELAADINSSLPDEQRDSESESAGVIELTGKELGDFPDTQEGRKQLRTVAREALNTFLGSWVPCPALGGDVEIRKSGVKKVISHSGDIRKLKVVSVIDQIIGKAKKLSTRNPYDGDVDKSAKLYHTLRTEILLEEIPLAVRVVIKEDIHGQFHYDMTIHDNDAIFDSVKDKGHDESQPLSVTTTNGGGTDPSRIARHQLDNSIEDDSKLINSPVFDSAGGKMVLNLLIEGEDPEIVEEGLEDKDSDVTLNPDPNPETVPEPNEHATIADVNKVMPLLKKFIGKRQLSAVGMGIRGEEGQFFKDKMVEIANTIQNMPQTYGQDGMGDEAIVYLHYFMGGSDWYITEKDMEDEQLQAFGLADLGGGSELGYISIQELIDSGVELDFYWEPKTIGEIKDSENKEDDESDSESSVQVQEEPSDESSNKNSVIDNVADTESETISGQIEEPEETL